MSTEVLIREYKDSDYYACYELWVELTKYHQEIYEDSSIGGENLGQGFIEHLKEHSDESIWVAEVDKKIVGLIGLIVKGKAAEVEPIIVNSLYRKKGIGNKLLQYIINLSSEKDLKYLSIRPVARNKNAIKTFYEMGFKTLGHLELFMNLREEEEIKKWKKSIDIHAILFDY